MHKDDIIIALTTEAHRRLVDEVLPALAVEYPGNVALLEVFFAKSIQYEYGQSLLLRGCVDWDVPNALPWGINETMMRLRECGEDLHLLVVRDGQKIRQIGRPVPGVLPEIKFRNVVEIDDSKFFDNQPWDAIVNPKNGKTRAHEAAFYGTLPPSFNQWEIEDYAGYSVAHVAAMQGTLPAGFKDWHLRNLNGDTVAHVAVTYGHLPADFDKWSLRDSNGNTVAHLAARDGKLPHGFNQWDLINTHEAYYGNTVAHEAAKNGTLPEDFDQWDLQNCNGFTVREIADDYRKKKGLFAAPGM